MQIYLVGGAVRDQLLGLPVKDRDWVVVGATPEQMLALGYRPVGKEFPVFLHPDNHEEYALARTERKTGKGYKGFVFHADVNVTLEQDLKRRDLTINAIAQDKHGNLIDPFNGQADIHSKKLRHVSEAFAEDPVRLLRLARFASKFPDFSVDAKTLNLMQQMVIKGEVDALVAERVWNECQRALEEQAPQRFFEILTQCAANRVLFADMQLTATDYHAMQVATNPVTRLAALLAGQTKSVIQQFIKRYRLPTEYTDCLLLTQQWYECLASLQQQTAEAILHFIKATDALRRPERFQTFCQACQAVHCGSLSSHITLINSMIAAIKAIDVTPLNQQQLKGQAFAAALKQLQLAAIIPLIP